MTDNYRIFQCASGVWYLEERETKNQKSLRTRHEAEAKAAGLPKHQASGM